MYLDMQRQVIDVDIISIGESFRIADNLPVESLPSQSAVSERSAWQDVKTQKCSSQRLYAGIK